MMDEVLSARLAKLKALAERGIGGEKENAETLLRRLSTKHGIDLESIGVDTAEMRWFMVGKSNEEIRLFGQCVYKIFGEIPLIYGIKRKPNTAGLICTAAQGIELELEYSFHRTNLKNEMKRFFTAYIEANHIFPPNAPQETEDHRSREDHLLRAGIYRRTRQNQIGGKKG